MQIIWITTQFPSNVNDTKGRFIYRTVKEISRQHYKLTIVNLYATLPPFITIIKDFKNRKKIYHEWKTKFPKKPELPLNANFNVIFAKYLRLPRGLFHFTEGWFSHFFIKKKLKRIITKNSLIHATWLFPEGDLANILYKKYNVPFAVTLMGSDVHYLQKGTLKWNKAKEIVKNAKFVTSVSQQLYIDLKNKSIDIPNEKKIITHTIYETEKFIIKNKKECRIKLNVDLDAKVILYAGNLRIIKNIDILIKSVSLLVNSDNIKNRKLKLIIAGKGEEEGKLKSLVENLNLNDVIFFTGGLNEDQLIDYYNLADIFCLPSKNEGLPNVVIESLLCGTPVVASAVGEIPYIVNENKNGLLVEPNNISELALKLENALIKNWDREALRNSVNFLAKDKVMNEYNDLYSKMEKFLKSD